MKVTVLGAAGFIGGATVDAFERLHARVAVHGMVRTSTLHDRPAPASLHVGDVRNPLSLRDAVRGADCVLHCASYIGYDPDLCQSVNVVGTRNVVEACASERVRRIVYVSTAAVYRGGPRRGQTESELIVEPFSTLSRSRAQAEQIVLNGGGIVLRPDMVFGRGDRWFIPALHRFTASIGGLVDGGSTRMSMIHVEDLGEMVASVALSDEAETGAFNIAYDEPVSVRSIAQLFPVLPAFAGSLPGVARDVAFERATQQGFTEHQFSLLTTDHWFNTERLARVTSPQRNRGPHTFQRDTDWYRDAI